MFCCSAGLGVGLRFTERLIPTGGSLSRCWLTAAVWDLGSGLGASQRLALWCKKVFTTRDVQLETLLAVCCAECAPGYLSSAAHAAMLTALNRFLCGRGRPAAERTNLRRLRRRLEEHRGRCANVGHLAWLRAAGKLNSGPLLQPCTSVGLLRSVACRSRPCFARVRKHQWQHHHSVCTLYQHSGWVHRGCAPAETLLAANGLVVSVCES